MTTPITREELVEWAEDPDLLFADGFGDRTPAFLSRPPAEGELERDDALLAEDHDDG